MSDFIIKTGDTVTFNPNFPPAIVVVSPGTITGSSKINIDGAIACMQGDEASVSVPAAYSSGAFIVLGVGTLTISALGTDQIGQKTSASQKPLILKGSTFTALFTVTVPATTSPPTSSPDTTPQYSGTGQFVATNVKSKGT